MEPHIETINFLRNLFSEHKFLALFILYSICIIPLYRTKFNIKLIERVIHVAFISYIICLVFSSNIFSDILSTTAIILSIATILTLIQFFDRYDLKKVIVAEEFKAINDIAKEVCNVHLMLQSFDKKFEFSGYRGFSVHYLTDLLEFAEKNELAEKPIYFHESYLKKLSSMYELSNHPNIIMFEFPHELKPTGLIATNINEIPHDALILADEPEYCTHDLLAVGVVYQNVHNRTGRSIYLWYILAGLLEDYYNYHFPEYTPKQIRIKTQSTKIIYPNIYA